MRHIVNCPHSRLAARQPNDLISVLAGPLKLLTFTLTIISIPSPPRSFRLKNLLVLQILLTA